MTQEIPRFGAPMREVKQRTPGRRTVESELFEDESVWDGVRHIARKLILVLGPVVLLFSVNHYYPLFPSTSSINEFGQKLKQQQGKSSTTKRRTSKRHAPPVRRTGAAPTIQPNVRRQQPTRVAPIRVEPETFSSGANERVDPAGEPR